MRAARVRPLAPPVLAEKTGISVKGKWPTRSRWAAGSGPRLANSILRVPPSMESAIRAAETPARRAVKWGAAESPAHWQTTPTPPSANASPAQTIATAIGGSACAGCGGGARRSGGAPQRALHGPGQGQMPSPSAALSAPTLSISTPRANLHANKADARSKQATDACDAAPTTAPASSRVRNAAKLRV